MEFVQWHWPKNAYEAKVAQVVQQLSMAGP